MPINKNGFSLVEMLIALAVSAIIIAAAFGSYAMIARNFDFQKDMKYIAQSARAVVDMINSDIRLAGYTAVDNGAITNAVMLSDSGTAACCDAISVVYDQTPTERRQVTYYTKQYTSDDTRFRLYKHICQVSTPYTIAQIQAGQCPATATLLAENPIADYVEDLQFSGSRGNCNSGDETYGCGVKKWITPTSVRSFSHSSNNLCESEDNNHINASGSADFMIDGNKNTFWRCGSAGARAEFIFPNKFRLEKIKVDLFPDLDGGTNGGTASTASATYPFGKDHSFYQEFNIYLDGSVCTWSTTCTPNQTMHSGNLFTKSFPNPSDAAIFCLDGCIIDMPQNTAVPSGFNVQQSVINKLELHINSALHLQYNNSNNVTGQTQANYKEVNEIEFYGEEYGGTISATEIETSILIRSPNEHGNVDRSVGSPLTLGNRTNTWSDKHLRDSFTTATVVRNLYYSSQ